MPDADRGNAPRSALSTSRTPGRSVGSSDPVERLLRTDSPRRLRSQRWEGCPRLERRESPLRQGRHPEGFGPRVDPRNAGPRGPKRPWEAAEAVGPRRGHKPMEGTSDPGARKGAGRNGLVRGATPRSRGSPSRRRHFRRPATGSGGCHRPVERLTARRQSRRWRHRTAANEGNSSKGRSVAGNEACLAPVRRAASGGPPTLAVGVGSWERVSVKRGEPQDR